MVSVNQKWLYALISVPFLVLVAAEQFTSAGSFLSSKSGSTGMSFAADLIFLNNIHIAFSYFLFYKIDEFKEVLDGHKAKFLALTAAMAVLFLTLTDLNWEVLGVLAILHAYLQSMGIYLLAFAAPASRRHAKWVILAFLIALLAIKKELWLPTDAVIYGLGAGLFLVLALMSRSWLGALFAARFFLWFAPTGMSGTSVAAIHGLEYLIVVYYLLRNKNINFSFKDAPVAAGLIGVLSYYTIEKYFYVTSKPLEMIFLFCVYAHYAFDSYSFRFQFAKQRALILPLFFGTKTAKN